ncbi:family 78 glycoside hydrolase catalytic domain [Maricaulis parjimensis]|uniref:family 78 glycoside hydrolase catalytic domain n=1 Tax=Maricaulis parjimensis TaxID=144023 RepID=UPI001EEED5E6|nr:family 78 glycoside hydrolase catalytic domain [Maricaulis parjimensis]
MKRSLMLAATCLAAVWAGACSESAQTVAPAPVATVDATGPGWITAAASLAADEANTPISLQFRRLVELEALPESFPVRISADNRFILYVNGERVADGPSRGDHEHWRYEVIDLAPFLVAGENALAIQVWNDGEFAALAQLTGGRTGLYLMPDDTALPVSLGDAGDWQVRVDASRTVGSGMRQTIEQVGGGYYAAGGPETITASERLDGWNRVSVTGGDWSAAIPLDSRPTPLTLVEDQLPQMRYTPISSGEVVRASGVEATGFPESAIVVPPHTEANILIDAGRVLAAYPVLETSGGAGAEVEMTYVEALYDPRDETRISNEFGGNRMIRYTDRARVDDGLARGLSDTLILDGGENERLGPYWWRGWRFVEITVQTGDEPLTLERFDTFETGYPFEQNGHFVSNDSELNRIWQIGWDTALFDAHETYMDTAYWEQLQYIGDTRIQMLLSYDVSGDPRLAVQALDAVDASRWNNNLPQSAWPETSDNVIPPFSLLWIGSLHDYWMRQPDTSVIERNLQGTREILDWYTGNLGPNGLVQETSGWPFVDWVGHLSGWEWRGGTGPEHCVISMQYFGALQDAAELETALGNADLTPVYLERAEAIRDSLNTACWNEERGLFADTPEQAIFSQHAGILPVLYDIIPEAQHRDMLERVTRPEGGIAPPEGMLGSTYYFSFYLAQAMDHAGLTDRYVDMLTPWREMLSQNFTTFPETPDPSRSDTHAWSGHPTTGLLTYVAGIQPAAPGFSRVHIAPHLGPLTSVDAAMMHPLGRIDTIYELEGDTLTARITLPEGLEGRFEWRGRTADLGSGENTFVWGPGTP